MDSIVNWNRVNVLQNFLLLDEIRSTSSSLEVPLEDKLEASVEVQDLICYWDKVSVQSSPCWRFWMGTQTSNQYTQWLAHKEKAYSSTISVCSKIPLPHLRNKHQHGAVGCQQNVYGKWPQQGNSDFFRIGVMQYWTVYMFLTVFPLSAESGCPVSSECLPHSDVRTAPGCHWTCWSWKGQWS